MNQLAAINIQPIANGFLVGHTVVSRFKDEQPKPVCKYCATYEEVCAYLKTIWPSN